MKDILVQRSIAERPPVKSRQRQALTQFGKNLVKYRWLYIMLIPPVAYFVIFQYIPLWNAQIAFKDFKPLLGVWKSPFTGFDHFITFFKSYYFTQLIGNTIIISVLKLIVGIPMAIGFWRPRRSTPRSPPSSASAASFRPSPTCPTSFPG